MALRLMLVSLVASLGFELPSPHDLESWGQSGRVWVAARVSELSTLSTWQEGETAADSGPTPMVVADDASPSVPAESPRVPAVDDLAFDVVVEGMASRFAEENATARVEAARIEAAIAATAEPARSTVGGAAEGDETLTFVEVLPVVVDTASREEGPSLEGPATEPTDEASAVREVAAAPIAVSRIDRLSHAVRLTRIAVEAWASLIDPAGSDRGNEEVVLSR